MAIDPPNRRGRLPSRKTVILGHLIRIRYGYQLSRLPEKCPCSAKFNIQHALSCKKGGFITQRHNALRDVTAKLMSEVCHDVKIEPQLNELTGENLHERTANNTAEARLDISARDYTGSNTKGHSLT